jgi:hypothetical protein
MISRVSHCLPRAAHVLEQVSGDSLVLLMHDLPGQVDPLDSASGCIAQVSWTLIGR